MSGSYVYIRSESQLYTVGFYDPSGNWHPESDHNDTKQAAARVHYLNGGDRLDFIDQAFNEGDGTYRP